MVAATFVSNSKYYSYPVELWEQGLKHLETKVFETRKVLKPEDIATIQNECLTELFKTHDTVYWLQADLIFYSEMTDRLIEISNTDFIANIGIPMHKAKIFLSDGVSGFGSMIIKKEFFDNDPDSMFFEDGARTKRYAGTWGMRVVDAAEMFGVDVGYLGYENFINHRKQQSKIWAGIKTQDVSELKLGFIDEKAFKIGLDYFNLHDEFREFKKI